MLALAVALFLVLGGKACSDTMATPQVRRAAVLLPGLARPVRVALIADIHVAGPDMPPARVERIVAQVNALQPDLVLVAGDLVSDKRIATRHYSTADAIAPLAALDGPVVAVPGNHDHWRDVEGIRRELEARGVAVLANEARHFGPLTVGGLDDDYTGHADVAATVRAMSAVGGARLLLSHSPDPFPEVPGSVPLMLAGHTHCGQIRYPWGGAPATMSRYGDRYACGIIHEDNRTLIVTGGLGTSVLPVRFGTRPEIWLIELRPQG